MTLDAQKITIRDSVTEDAAFLSKWLLDPPVLRWFPLNNAREVEDAVKVWLSYNQYGCCFTICYEGVPCGMAVTYWNRYKKFRHQSLFGIIVDENYRGNGLGTLLFKHLKKHAKESLKLEILHLEVYQGNPAKSLYDRLGFQVYGVQPHFLKEDDGTYRDKINMELYL